MNNNPIDDVTGLPYVSSAPDFAVVPKDVPVVQDQADLPVLEKMFKLLKARKSFYASTDSLEFGKNITIENQLIINQHMQHHITELENMLGTTISKVREAMNERQ